MTEFYIFRYGKIHRVNILPEKDNDKPCAIVAFMDIKCASKAQSSTNTLNGVPICTEYSEPTASGGLVKITRAPHPPPPAETDSRPQAGTSDRASGVTPETQRNYPANLANKQQGRYANRPDSGG